jgi:signal transduction histidine kinase
LQDQERRRIAREIHDSLGQYLAAVKINLELLSNGSLEGKYGVLGESIQLLERCIVETRTLSHLLHPPLLDEAGFASAARWFVTGFSQRSGIPVSLELPPDLSRLPDAIEIALFRVLQESLTNVHRHSRSASAEISLRTNGEHLTMEVRDCGQGMPRHVLDQIRNDGTYAGVGLAGMRERMHELGGRLEIHSDKSGTTIRAVIPANLRSEGANLPYEIGKSSSAA